MVRASVIATLIVVVGCGRLGFEGDTGTDAGGIEEPDPDSAVAPTVAREWSVATPADNPGQLLAPKLTYFPPNQSILLYGGTRVVADVATTSAALWEYDGTNWRQICDPCGAGVRAGHEYVFDVAQGLSLLFGGDNGAGGGLADVWHYSEGTGWRVHGTTGTPPSAMVNFSASYDVTRGVTVVITGENEVFELDGTVWSGPLDVVPGARSDRGSSATYDPTRGGVVVYGGTGADSALLDDAWVWNGSDWTMICDGCTGQPRQGASVVYDPVLRETFVVGGEGSAPIAGTWILGEAQPVDAQPNARNRAGVAYDLNRDVLVVFGGSGPDCAGALAACDETLEMALVP